MTRNLLAIAVLSTLAACQVVDTAHTDELDLENRTFLSTQITRDGAALDLPDGTLDLRFHEYPRISASGGCNSFGAEFSLDNDRTFVVTNGSWTEMGCEEDLHAQDDWYFGFLGSEPILTLDGDELTLEGPDTTITFVDREIATPDRTLESTLWTVDTLFDGEAASTTGTDSPATLLFTDDGLVSVHSGCNSGTASWTRAGATVTFSGLALTEMACDAATMALEQHVLDVLGTTDPVALEIDADRLVLMNGDVGLGLEGTDRGE